MLKSRKNETIRDRLSLFFTLHPRSMASNEAFFQPICDQAMSEFTKYCASNKFPRASTILTPANFYMQLSRIIPQQTIYKFFKVFKKIEEFPASDQLGLVVGVVPNDPVYVKQICDKFKQLPKFVKHMLIIPRYGALSQKAVEESGIQDQIKVQEFHADICQLDNSRFLVNAPHCFRRVFVDNDIDDLTTIARCLVKIEILNGVFPKYYTFGIQSGRVAHILNEMKAQISNNAFTATPQFHSLIIIDRTADLFTPLLTQLSYGGMLDDNLNPECGILELPPEVKGENRIIILNDYDAAYREIRAMPVDKGVEFCTQKLDEIKEVQKKLKPGMDSSSFMIEQEKANKLKDLKPLLELHLELMGFLVNGMTKKPEFGDTMDLEYQTRLGLLLPTTVPDNMIKMDENWDEALRLYCLLSVFHRGLSYSTSSSIRRKYINKYGFDFIQHVSDLNMCGLLKQEVPTWQFWEPHLPEYSDLAKAFKLKAEKDAKDDLGFAYDGYVPLSVRLVQSVTCQPGDSMHISSGSKQRLLEKMNCPYIGPADDDRGSIFRRRRDDDKPTTKRIMVFFVGGITESEIGLIHEMGRVFFQGSVEFYIGSTSIITGKRFMHEVCPCTYVPPPPPPPKK